MLSDRDYMRSSESRGTSAPTALACVIALIIISYILELMALNWGRGTAGPRWVGELMLSAEGVRSGRWWQLVTYALLHDSRSVLHIVGNVLGIYFAGRMVLPRLGNVRFALFCLLAAILGALAWMAANWSGGGHVLGASAVSVGLLILFACYYPNTPVTLLLFFVLPVTIRPRILAWVVVGIDLLGLLIFELPKRGDLVAHSAHLGGAFAAWIFFRWVQRGETSEIAALPRWLGRPRPKSVIQPAVPAVASVAEPDALLAEVNRILDKISAEGFGSLTPGEKRTLEEAKDVLSRR